MTASATRHLGRARHMADMLRVLAISDLRMRYGRGGWRVLKWLLDPIAALGVYVLLVVVVLGTDESAPGLSLACAIVPFQLVISSIANALGAVELRSSIISNMDFPRTLIPLSSVATEAVTFAPSMILIPVTMAIYGVGPTAALLWLPVALVVAVILTAAMAYPATLIGIWNPEMKPFAISLVRAMFFIAPGLIALKEIPGLTGDLLILNPLTGVFESFRDAVLYGSSPAAWELLTPLLAAAVLLAVSVPAYRRDESRLAKLVG